MTANTREACVAWLHKFGYLATPEPDNLEFASAMKGMQQRYGLDQDGIISPVTSRAMGLFRCGVPDIMTVRVAGSSDCRWQKTSLTYYVAPNTRLNGHTAKQTADVIAAAAESWSKHVPLKITASKSSRADVVIGVGRGSRYGFDGVGNTLAWAYLPCSARDEQLQMMFDRDEPWSLDLRNSAGVYSLAVAVHEWGHILGLDHSNKDADVMAPFYNPQVSLPQRGDVTRLRKLYGTKKAEDGQDETVISLSVRGTAEIHGERVQLDLEVVQ